MERRKAKTRKDSTRKGKVRGRGIDAGAGVATKARRARASRAALPRQMVLP
jgi:hypothetical protein